MQRMDREWLSSRRGFIKDSLGLAVVSALAPSVVLGRALPRWLYNDGLSKHTSAGAYTIRVSEYPDLVVVGGSVMLISDEQLLLNEDHVEWRDANLRRETESFACKQGWYPISVTRVKASGVDAFVAVSTFCPHEAEYQVAFDPIRFIYFCCHQESSFRPDGTWIHPDDPDALSPEAPRTGTVRNGLRKFSASFDDADTITLEIPTLGVAQETHEEIRLGNCIPNPCSRRAVIPFSLAHSGFVRITLHSHEGRFVRDLLDERREPGDQSLTIDVSDLPAGTYIYRLHFDRAELSRSIIVVR